MAGVHLERSRKLRLHLDDSGGCLLDVAFYLEKGVCLDEALHLDDAGGVSSRCGRGSSGTF